MQSLCHKGRRIEGGHRHHPANLGSRFASTFLHRPSAMTLPGGAQAATSSLRGLPPLARKLLGGMPQQLTAARVLPMMASAAADVKGEGLGVKVERCKQMDGQWAVDSLRLKPIEPLSSPMIWQAACRGCHTLEITKRFPLHDWTLAQSRLDYSRAVHVLSALFPHPAVVM